MDERVKEVEAKLELLRVIRDEKKAQYFKILSPVEKEKAKLELDKAEIALLQLEQIYDDLLISENAKYEPVVLAPTDENGQETNPPINIELITAPTTVSTVAQGNITNTTIATANKNRMHACDTTLFVQRNKAMAIIAEQLVRGIRSAVKAILSALGINPGASGIAQYIKQIKGLIEDITEFLTKINEGIAKYALVVAKIGALIQYLSNLPSELLAYFKKCIIELYNELKKQFMDAVKQGIADFNAEQALDAQIASESTLGLDVVTADDGSTLITNEDGTFTATNSPIDKIDANIGKEFSSLLDSTKTLVKTASATAANITSLPAKTLSALTNPTASSTPLTSAQASSLSKEVFGDILPTTTYEAA
jgi:hypothetical protein